MRFKKQLIVLLVCSLFLILPVNAGTLPANMTTGSALIGGKPGSLIYMKTGGGRTGEITIGTGKFYTVDKAQNHINRKNSEPGKSVVASVNGGYFDAYTTNYRTYAAIVQNGVLINGGGDQKKPTLGFTSTGEALIDRVRIQASILLRGSVKITAWPVNTWFSDPGAIMLFNSSFGASIAIPSTSAMITIKNEVVSQVVSGMAAKLDRIPAGTVVLVYNSQAWQSAKINGSDPKPGNFARLITDFSASRELDQEKWEDTVTAVSAGPMILSSGKDVTDQNSDFTEAKQSPTYVALRSFAAVMKDGRLLLGTATASPKQLAQYLLSIGASDAMSLDGGASTMLYRKDSGFITTAGRNLSNVVHIVDYASGTLPVKTAPPDMDMPSLWAQPEIKEADITGLIPDNVDGAYKTNITRQEFCNLAMRLVTALLGETRVTSLIVQSGISYSEVREAITDTYDIDVLNCYRLGIVGGKGNRLFDPHASIYREEAAKILSNICKIVGIEALGQEIVFQDTAKISSWAADYVGFISKAGIMGGSNGYFNPLGYYTREEAIATMNRMYKRASIH